MAVKPNIKKARTKPGQRIGLYCPSCRGFIDAKIGIDIRLEDDPNITAAWFQGKQCKNCGMVGNVCMALREGKWVAVVVSFVRK